LEKIHAISQEFGDFVRRREEKDVELQVWRSRTF